MLLCHYFFLVSYKDGELWSYKLFVFWPNTTCNSNKQTSRRRINTILISGSTWNPNRDLFFKDEMSLLQATFWQISLSGFHNIWTSLKICSCTALHLAFTSNAIFIMNYQSISAELMWTFFLRVWQHLHLKHMIIEL